MTIAGTSIAGTSSWVTLTVAGTATVTMGIPTSTIRTLPNCRFRRSNGWRSRLSAICPDWPWFRSFIRDSWLCAPKAFRFLERLLWCVGKEKRAVSLPSHPMESGDRVPGYLQCEDTYRNIAGGKEWVRAFVAGMRLWIAGGEPDGTVASDIQRRLADRTPVKLWLVGLYLRKIELLNPFGVVESLEGD